MTRKQIRRLVKELRPIMRLERWKIDLSFPDKLTDEDALAQITRVGDYFEARMSIGPKYKEWTKKQAREIVAHELAHLVLGDIEIYVCRLHKNLMPPALLESANGAFESLLEAATDWIGVIASDGIDW